MRVTKELSLKIKDLPDRESVELNRFLDKLLENNCPQTSKKCAAATQLEKLKNKPYFEDLDTVNLAKNLRKDWDVVKQNKLLTYFVIDSFCEFNNPQSEIFAAKRINGDSRTGSFFEDKFFFLLKSYLLSKSDLLTLEGKFEKIKLTLNDSIAVPGERRKRKPDVLIRDYVTDKPICIMELKASFTKRSLAKIYNVDYEMWKQLNENLKFLYVIFRSNSENKIDVYKKAEGCRIICYDLKTDKDSRIKGIKPQIVNSIEDIFEEVYQAISDFEINKVSLVV
ncbi:hypothetical protein [Methanosarcina mazei]|uniref:Uncharacterized protein n=1 Tax=Methanosarcina mazei S-6 TaxID=213585 RepID=A0A0E3RFI2_METMZ|nr:hypothetical protein [Methanosarcina mazei]AKB64922.1 hypothetical protein MSMAS_1726 [Methanosarcina mazei S-6]